MGNRIWWALVLRGVCAILFGLAALFWTGLTMTVLVVWFGVYALVDGVFAIISAFRAASHHQRWWLLLLDGIFGIGAGVLTFVWPQITALVLIFIIAAWAIITGVFEIMAAFSAPWPTGSRWLMGISGFLSIVFGFLVYFNPIGGAITVVWLIGAYALAFGVFLFVLGLRLKSAASSLKTSTA